MINAEAATLVSATAAIAAATLTAVNLVLSGRRADLEWKRKALESALVDFLTASYDHRNACNKLAGTELGDSAMVQGDSARLWAAMEAADDSMMSTLTRIRVLASDESAELAKRLLECNYQSASLVRSGDFSHFQGTRRARSDEFKSKRDAFTKEARRLLGAT